MKEKYKHLLKGNFNEESRVLKLGEQLLHVDEGEAVGSGVFVKRLV